MADRGRIVGIATLGDEATWGDTLNLNQAIAVVVVQPGEPAAGVSGNQFLKLGLSEAEQCELGEYLKSLPPGEER